MKRFVINAQLFSSVPTFFEHADEVLCVDFTSGRNMNAFRDILMGGFGAFEYEEPIEIIWRGADKSRRDLGEAYDWFVEAIREKSHITFYEEKAQL